MLCSEPQTGTLLLLCRFQRTLPLRCLERLSDSEFIAVGMLFAVPVIETPMLADTLRFTPCGMELTEIVFVVGSDEG